MKATRERKQVQNLNQREDWFDPALFSLDNKTLQ